MLPDVGILSSALLFAVPDHLGLDSSAQLDFLLISRGLPRTLCLSTIVMGSLSEILLRKLPWNVQHRASGGISRCQFSSAARSYRCCEVGEWGAPRALHVSEIIDLSHQTKASKGTAAMVYLVQRVFKNLFHKPGLFLHNLTVSVRCLESKL